MTGPCLLNQFSTVWTAPVSVGYGLIRDPNDSGLQRDGGIFDTSAFGTGEVYIYVRPELSGIRHNLDQNYQLSFSRNLTSAFDQNGRRHQPPPVSPALRATVSLTASGDIHEHWRMWACPHFGPREPPVELLRGFEARGLHFRVQQGEPRADLQLTERLKGNVASGSPENGDSGSRYRANVAAECKSAFMPSGLGGPAWHQLELAEIERSRPLGDERGYDRLPIGAAAEDSRRRLAEVGIALPQPGERNV